MQGTQLDRQNKQKKPDPDLNRDKEQGPQQTHSSPPQDTKYGPQGLKKVAPHH